MISRHKILSGLVVIGLAAGSYGIYRTYTGSGREIKYVLASAEKGTIISSLSGSGQVSASNQIDIKPKASGEVVAVNASDGAWVVRGEILGKIDARMAEKAVRDTELNLERARLDLEKIKGAKLDSGSFRSSKEKALDDLSRSYDDGFTDVANAFLDLPTAITGLNDLLFSDSIKKGAQANIDYYSDTARIYDERATSFKQDAYNYYQAARLAYDRNFADYKVTSRSSDKAAIEELIDETYATTRVLTEAIKSANNLIQFYKDRLTERTLTPVALADTHLSSLNTYTGKTNTHLLNLLTIKNTIQSDKEAIGGADLDLRAQEILLKQRENELRDAQEKLDDYSIHAPFTGTVSKVNLKVGDSISSATIAATLVTRQKLAEISLNEVDAAKVKVGQKATLTFDAVPGLSIAGEVSAVDTVGTISQGVVTYMVKAAFDTQDERVKTAMSVTANIIIDAKPDILMVPNSAVKARGSAHYVEIPDEADLAGQANIQNPAGLHLDKPIRRQTVEVGVANDEFTEILSGLKERDVVISNTITPPKITPSSQQQNSTFRIPGLPGGGGGGGNFRR